MRASFVGAPLLAYGDAAPVPGPRVTYVTTVRLPEELLRQANEASRRGETLTSLIETIADIKGVVSS